MTPMDDGFARAVDAALARALPGVFPAAAVTCVVADPSEPEHRRVESALGRLLATLPRAGVPRGRVTVLMAAAADGTACPPARARALRAALGIPVLVHDPARSACFVPGRAGGSAVEVCDELREAEAVLAVGALAEGAEASALHALVFPGLASADTRARLAPAALEEARALVRVDLALGWRPAGAAGWSVLTAGAGSHP
jgi:hypothetical protein